MSNTYVDDSYNPQTAVVPPATGVLRVRGAVATAQSSTAPVLAGSGTVATKAIGVSRVAPAAAVTGVILQAGTVPGQRVTVVNESIAASTITFAVAATSNVANGVTTVIAGLTAVAFVWDSVTARWYPGG